MKRTTMFLTALLAAVAAFAQTVTLPPQTVTVTIPAQTVTITLPAQTVAVTPAVVVPPPVIVVTPPPALSLRVANGSLVDGAGKVVQLRGANASGLESTPIQGWSPGDPWGGVAPNFASMQAWHLNAVRIPLNEASWLGLTTYDYSGAARKADPGANYVATVKAAVDGATKAGLYVILDLHWSAPNLTTTGHSTVLPFSPMGQAPLADADHSIAFWAGVASAFKAYPNVMFDLFNEPYPDNYGQPAGANAWVTLLNGGPMAKFPNNTSGGANFDDVQMWTAAGTQAMLNAVRATGASNVVMVAGVGWAGDVSQWLQYSPTDPLKQMAASVHLYPKYGTAYGTAAYATLDAARSAQLAAIIAAGYPVVIGEVGGRNSTGTVGDQFTSNVLAWADTNKASVMGWTWDPWGNADNVLIKDAAGTPTDGFGKVYHDWAVSK